MLEIRCPSCRMLLKVENAAAGHKLACECGKTWTLPPAPPAGDFKICGNCTRLCENAAPECPDCFMDFKTGRVPEKQPEPTFFSTNRPLIMKAVFVLAILLTAGVVYLNASMSKIGISKDAPLGALKKGKDFSGLSFSPATGPLSAETEKHGAAVYLAPRLTTEKMAHDGDVFIVTGSKGAVLLISGSYQSGTNMLGFKLPESPSKHFFDAMMKELKLEPFADDEWKLEERKAGYVQWTEAKGIRKTDKYTLTCLRKISSFASGVNDTCQFEFRAADAPAGLPFTAPEFSKQLPQTDDGGIDW